MGSFGKCKKCPPAAREGRLYGEGVCYAHFIDETIDIPREAKVTTATKTAEKKDTLGAWFNEQRKHIPHLCENCNKPIQPTIPQKMTWKTAIAHILPKQLFKSVQTHAMNRIFLCWQCHSDYDKKGAAHQQSMKVATVARERYQEFKQQIAKDELRHLPEWIQ